LPIGFPSQSSILATGDRVHAAIDCKAGAVFIVSASLKFVSRASFGPTRTQRALVLEEHPDGDGLKTIQELGLGKEVPLQKYGASPCAPNGFVEVDCTTGAVGQPRTDYKMIDAAISMTIWEHGSEGYHSAYLPGTGRAVQGTCEQAGLWYELVQRL